MDFAPQGDIKRRGVAWLLVFPGAVFLWITFNALFMVPSEHPGHYDLTQMVMAVVAALLALLFSFASARILIRKTSAGRSRYRSVFATPQILFCSVVLLVYVGLLVLRPF